MIGIFRNSWIFYFLFYLWWDFFSVLIFRVCQQIHVCCIILRHLHNLDRKNAAILQNTASESAIVEIVILTLNHSPLPLPIVLLASFFFSFLFFSFLFIFNFWRSFLSFFFSRVLTCVWVESTRTNTTQTDLLFKKWSGWSLLLNAGKETKKKQKKTLSYLRQGTSELIITVAVNEHANPNASVWEKNPNKTCVIYAQEYVNKVPQILITDYSIVPRKSLQTLETHATF